jgi:hypothetical protein
VEATVSLQQALFWVKLHRELLAVQQRALWRMRALLTDDPGSPDVYEPDIQLVTNEIERVMDRLRHWEEVVDRIR